MQSINKNNDIDNIGVSYPIKDSQNTTPQNNEIQDLFNSAKSQLNESQGGGITKEQIDALHKHEGINAWTSIFLNLLGARQGIDSKKFMAPLEERVENERKGINLQNQLAQQQFTRAQGLQNFGLGQMKVGQELKEQEYANKPIDKIKLATIGAYMKQAGQGDFDPEQYKNMTNAQADKLMPELYKLATNQTSLDKAKASAALGKYYSITGPTGDISLFNPRTHDIQTPIQTPQRDENKVYEFSDIQKGQAGMSAKQKTEFMKEFSPIQKEAYKLNKDENEYTTAVNSLRKEVESARQGNYVASRTLPDREAKVLGDLAGKLTNMQVQMQKDNMSGGALNRVESTVNSLAGHGSLTYQDAKNILSLTNEIEGQRKNYFDSRKNILRGQANELAGGGKWNFDKALFGSGGVSSSQSSQYNLPNVKTEQKNQPTQVPGLPPVKMFNDPDEYLKHIGGM